MTSQDPQPEVSQARSAMFHKHPLEEMAAHKNLALLRSKLTGRPRLLRPVQDSPARPQLM